MNNKAAHMVSGGLPDHVYMAACRMMAQGARYGGEPFPRDFGTISGGLPETDYLELCRKNAGDEKPEMPAFRSGGLEHLKANFGSHKSG